MLVWLQIIHRLVHLAPKRRHRVKNAGTLTPLIIFELFILRHEIGHGLVFVLTPHGSVIIAQARQLAAALLLVWHR